jgi:hypothetical protein
MPSVIFNAVSENAPSENFHNTRSDKERVGVGPLSPQYGAKNV